MKIVKIVGALVSVLALGVLAVSAFAADNTVWLCEEKVILGSSSRCLVDSENLEAFKFYDLTADSEVECAVGSITNEGWVGPGSEDEITLVTFSSPTTNCTPTAKALNLSEAEVTNVCEKVEGVTPIHMPWATLLLLKAGISYDEIGEQGTNGEPGYELTCKTALGSVADKCEKPAEGNDLEVNNLVGSATELPLVDVLFTLAPVNSDKERTKCSVGGAESGVLVGEILFEALSSSGSQLSLEVSEP